MNARISGVMVSGWFQRCNGRTSRERNSPSPVSNIGSSTSVIAGEDVIARAEQGEIVRREPFQKLHRFGDFAGIERRRIGAQFGDDVAQPRQHRLPILHADANVGENVFERAHDLGAPRRIRDAFDVDVDEAFALAAILRAPLKPSAFPPRRARRRTPDGPEGGCRDRVD